MTRAVSVKWMSSLGLALSPPYPPIDDSVVHSSILDRCALFYQSNTKSFIYSLSNHQLVVYSIH